MPAHPIPRNPHSARPGAQALKTVVHLPPQAVHRQAMASMSAMPPIHLFPCEVEAALRVRA